MSGRTSSGKICTKPSVKADSLWRWAERWTTFLCKNCTEKCIQRWLLEHTVNGQKEFLMKVLLNLSETFSFGHAGCVCWKWWCFFNGLWGDKVHSVLFFNTINAVFAFSDSKSFHAKQKSVFNPCSFTSPWLFITCFLASQRWIDWWGHYRQHKPGPFTTDRMKTTQIYPPINHTVVFFMWLRQLLYTCSRFLQ